MSVWGLIRCAFGKHAWEVRQRRVWVAYNDLHPSGRIIPMKRQEVHPWRICTRPGCEAMEPVPKEPTWV